MLKFKMILLNKMWCFCMLATNKFWGSEIGWWRPRLWGAHDKATWLLTVIMELNYLMMSFLPEWGGIAWSKQFVVPVWEEIYGNLWQISADRKNSTGVVWDFYGSDLVLASSLNTSKSHYNPNFELQAAVTMAQVWFGWYFVFESMKTNIGLALKTIIK